MELLSRWDSVSVWGSGQLGGVWRGYWSELARQECRGEGEGRDQKKNVPKKWWEPEAASGAMKTSGRKCCRASEESRSPGGETRYCEAREACGPGSQRATSNQTSAGFLFPLEAAKQTVVTLGLWSVWSRHHVLSLPTQRLCDSPFSGQNKVQNPSSKWIPFTQQCFPKCGRLPISDLQQGYDFIVLCPLPTLLSDFFVQIRSVFIL